MDLALVMPVYNEEECIVDVVRSWHGMLNLLGVDFQMLVLNDGSRDGTAEALEDFADYERVEVIKKENSGHGPTILLGYRKSVELADWVFQCDSDNEMMPEHFPELWEKRADYDALFGIRTARNQNIGRKLIRVVSRASVHLLYGRSVADVNSQYRLIRSCALQPLVAQITYLTLAPNIIISGLLARRGCRIYNTPVPHQGRTTGTVSIVKWKLWKLAARAFVQTIVCSFSVKPLDNTSEPE